MSIPNHHGQSNQKTNVFSIPLQKVQREKEHFKDWPKISEYCVSYLQTYRKLFLIRNTYYETNKKSSLATQTNISQPYIAWTVSRRRSRTAATSKMEHFVIINNGWKPLAIITKSSILDIAAVLDPPLVSEENKINCTNLVRFLYYNYSQTNPDIFFSLYISHDAIQDDVTCSIDVLMTVNFDFCFQLVFHENLE